MLTLAAGDRHVPAATCGTASSGWARLPQASRGASPPLRHGALGHSAHDTG